MCKADSKRKNRRLGKKDLLYQTLRLEVTRYNYGASVYSRNKSAYAITNRNAKKNKKPGL
jgi:hypothetical protein